MKFLHMIEELYEILGFSSRTEPSSAEIRRAYRKLSLKWHPDKNPVFILGFYNNKKTPLLQHLREMKRLQQSLEKSKKLTTNYPMQMRDGYTSSKTNFLFGTVWRALFVA